MIFLFVIKMLKKKYDNDKIKKNISLFTLFVTAVHILLLIAISLYNFMSLDDYFFAMETGNVWRESHSLFATIKKGIVFTFNRYMTWQGNYTWVLPNSVLLGIFGESAYYIVTILVIGMLLLGNYTLVYEVFNRICKAGKSEAVIIANTLFLMETLFMPYPVEGMYWFCGSFEYMFFYGLMMFTIACMLHQVNKKTDDRTKKILFEVFIGILQFAVAGSNFVVALILGITDVCFIIYALLRNKSILKYEIIIAAFFVTAFILNVAAPGNVYRDAAEGADISVFYAIYLSFAWGIKYIITNLFPPYILLAILLIPIFIHIAGKSGLSFPYPLFVLIFSFCIFSAHFTPSAYSIGQQGPGRVLNLYRVAFFLWLYGNEFYCAGFVVRKYKETLFKERNRTFRGIAYAGCTAALILFFASLYFYGGTSLTSVSAALSLKRGEGQAYYETHLERLAILRDASVRDAVLPDFEIKPYLLYCNDIETFDSSWMNTTMAEYYGKETVVRE